VRWNVNLPRRLISTRISRPRDASPEFGEQRRLMGALLERFERHVFRLDDAETDKERS